MSVERAGTPGAAWESELRSLGEVVVPEDEGESPFGWSETPLYAAVSPREASGDSSPANRAARRAARRTARREGQR